MQHFTQGEHFHYLTHIAPCESRAAAPASATLGNCSFYSGLFQLNIVLNQVSNNIVCQLTWKNRIIVGDDAVLLGFFYELFCIHSF